MKHLTRRILKAALTIIISAAIIIIFASVVLSAYASRKLRSLLEEKNISIGSVHVNLLTRGIKIKQAEWVSANQDSAGQQKRVELTSVRIEGINLRQLIQHKLLKINRIDIDGGAIKFISHRSTLKAKAKQIDFPFTSLFADEVSFSNVTFHICPDSIHQYQGSLSTKLVDLELSDTQHFQDASAYTLRNIELGVSDLTITQHDGLYNFKILSARFSREKQTLDIDSLVLKPLLSKLEFGRSAKQQLTRTEISIPKINMTGVNLATRNSDTTFMISGVDIHKPVLYAFKDKRLPFKRKKKFKLPMEMFRELTVGFEVDSINIIDGKITYEEIPDNESKGALIVFDNLELLSAV